MNVSPSTAVTDAPALPVQAPRSAMLTSDFDTFLRMLTVQIQNQDPLNPMQSTEFATQLATFAGVEQQVRTNERLESLSALMGLSTLAQLSGWIGMEARVTGPVTFQGTPITVIPEPDPLAAASELVVTDTSGRVVARQPLPPGGGEMLWAGTDAQGQPLGQGVYRLSVQGQDSQGNALPARAVDHFATVREARGNRAGGIELVFAGGIAVPVDQVTGLRRPSGFDSGASGG